MKRILFIINPRSGTREKADFASQVNNTLNKKLFSFEMAYTQYPGHAIELSSKAAKEGVEIVAAVGGDGSVNETAQGVQGTESMLAIIPKGSGNGLARALNIPIQTDQALTIINRDTSKLIDVGFANDHLFVSNAGTGFDTLIARLFKDRSKRGLVNYSKLVMHAVRNYPSKHYHLIIDGEKMNAPAFFVTAANGNQFGYNFKIAPHAALDDGWLDLCIMKPLKPLQIPVASFKSLLGKLEGSGFAKLIRFKNMTITREEPLEWMQVDGDAVPVINNRVDIHIQPASLKVLI